MSNKRPDPGASLSILDLPHIVTLLYERAKRPLLPGAQKPLGLFVRYLRRKPARGLAVVYAVDEIERCNKAHANDPNRSVSLTVDEQALDGAHICFTEAPSMLPRSLYAINLLIAASFATILSWNAAKMKKLRLET